MVQNEQTTSCLAIATTLSKTSTPSSSQAQTNDEQLGYVPSFISSPSPDIYRVGSYLVLDWETTNLDYGSALVHDNRIVTGHWCINGIEYKSLSTHGLDTLFGDIASADFVVAHNAKFEHAWLVRLGYADPILWYDTMLGEYVWAGNRKVPLNLDAVAEKYTGLRKESNVAKLLEDGVCPSTIDIKELDSYCKQDVEITDKTFRKQLALLSDLGLLPSLYTRCLLIPILCALEARGLALDRDKVRIEFTKYNEQLNELKSKIATFTGGVNPASPKQMGSYLYDTLGFAELADRNGDPIRTPAGGRSTGIDTIVALRCTNDRQREFVELYKDFGSLKVNTKTLEKMWQCCLDTPKDQVPILYASYNQAVTQTHRLSSSGAKYSLQFHNFNTDFKPLFRARQEGWSVGEGDGAQLEFRVAVHLGRDPVGAADIRNPKFDAHYQTAEVLYKKERKDVSKAERNASKPRTFKPLYGGMSGTADERKYYRFFQQRYRSIFKTQTAWTYEVARNKKLVTETGLIFYWPDCKVQSDGYVTGKTQIFNYPVQSLATADIIPIGVVCCYYRMLALGMDSFLVNTIHDSIIGEIAPGEDELFRRVVETSLTVDTFKYLNDCYRIRFTVPLGCESKVGTHWGTGEERKYNLDPRELSMN